MDYADYLAAFSQTHTPVKWPLQIPNFQPRDDIWPAERCRFIITERRRVLHNKELDFADQERKFLVEARGATHSFLSRKSLLGFVRCARRNDEKRKLDRPAPNVLHHRLQNRLGAAPTCDP